MPTAIDEARSKTATPRILLVEDQRIIGLATAQQIRKQGYDVALAGSGEEALELVTPGTQSEKRFDLILMDVDLGKGIDGVEASQRILSRYHLPVVFLTSHSDRETLGRVREVSRYGYVLKSSGELQLQLAIETALDLFKAHSRIEERERELEAIYESIPVSLLLVTPEMRVSKANRQARLAGGERRAEASGSLVGAVLRCVHALEDPEACGSTPNCESCPVRIALRRTIESGTAPRSFEALLPVERNGEIRRTRCTVNLMPLTPEPNSDVLIAILEQEYE